MKHKEIEKLIQKRLDRETNPDEESRLDEHLAQCSHCARQYQEMTQIGRSVKEITQFYPQAGFNTRVLAKLGLRRRVPWLKTAIALAGTWVAALLFFAYSPLPAQLFSRIATSVPAIMKFFDKIELIVSSFSQVLSPAVKNSLTSLNPGIGLVFSILFVYFLGKALQKEVKCRA